MGYTLKVKSGRSLPRVPWHLVDPRPWPFTTSVSLLCVVLGLTRWINGRDWRIVIYGAVLLSVSVIRWFRDIVIEATFQGIHTKPVQRGLKLGFKLFLLSELILFFSFFWAFIHRALCPSVEIGCCWPPAGLTTLNPWQDAAVNTCILLTSGARVTWSHKAIKAGVMREAYIGLLQTIGWGCLFTYSQYQEYKVCPFTIADRVYGSCFFMLTGLHGLHVIGGTRFLIARLFRIGRRHFSTGHHLGYVFAIWYWHFVDIIWLFVWGIVYIWGSWI